MEKKRGRKKGGKNKSKNITKIVKIWREKKESNEEKNKA